MGPPCLLFLLFALYYSCTCQVTIPSTDPPVTTNEGIVDLPAVENAANVSVFCAVTFQGNPVNTNWRLGPSSTSLQLIDFDEPQFALENAPRFTNLTIRLFSRASLDMMVLECTNGFFVGGNFESALFLPRFIG